jgi:hypothetical protein
MTVVSGYRRPLKCVRCGNEPRLDDRFLGSECIVSGDYARESEQATRAVPDTERPDTLTTRRRKWLMETCDPQWYGGWDRATTRRVEVTVEVTVTKAESVQDQHRNTVT